MRSRSRGRRRSVDKGMCGPGIQPRKKITPGRRRCRRKRKAPSGVPISRGATESRAVRDPVHVRKHLEREPGDPKSATGSSCLGTHREVWVLNLDIKGFFDGLSHEWLVKFVEHRVADRRVVRLIQNWLSAGVLEEGKRIRT